MTKEEILNNHLKLSNPTLEQQYPDEYKRVLTAMESYAIQQTTYYQEKFDELERENERLRKLLQHKRMTDN